MAPIRSILLLFACLLAACGGGGDPAAAPPDAEVTGTYPLKRLAVGDIREIAQEAMQIEVVDVSDSRCPAAAICVTAGFAAVELNIRPGTASSQRVTVTLDAGGRDQQTVFSGYRFTLDRLDPYPVNGPLPKDQYRADITVRKL